MVTFLAVIVVTGLVLSVGLAGVVVPPLRHVAVISGRSVRVVSRRSWRMPLLTAVEMVEMSPVDVPLTGSVASGILTIEPDPNHLPPSPLASFRARALWLLDRSADVPDVAAEWGRQVEKLVEATGWRLVGVEARRTAPLSPGTGGTFSALADHMKAAIDSGSAERALEDVAERVATWVARATSSGAPSPWPPPDDREI